MAFNIQTHNKNQGTLPQSWHAQQTDRVGYNKYEEKMSKARALFSWIGVVVLSIFSFSGYFIYLMKSKNGQQSLQNLKDRKIIHYVKSQGTDSNSSRKTEDVANQLLNFRINATPKFDPQAIIQKVDAQVIKKCVEYSNQYKELFKQLVDVKKQGKVGILLDSLNGINSELRKKLEELIHANNFTEENFVKIFAPFFKTISDLEKSVQRAKQIGTDQISENEKKFREFRSKLADLKDYTGWLVSLKSEPSLFNYACKLVQDGEYYNYKFIDCIADKDLWNKCLKSMDNTLVEKNIDRKAYDQIKSDFKEHRTLHAKCLKYLVEDFNFSLYTYLESKLKYTLTHDKIIAFFNVMNKNGMDADYIQSYFATDDKYSSNQSLGVKELYTMLKGLITDKVEEEAKLEAEIAYSRELALIKHQEEALQTDYCKNGFKETKKIFNEDRDTIEILYNVEPFLDRLLGENNDKFFKFIDDLYTSTDVKNYKEPTINYIKTFEEHLPSLDGYKEALAHINKFSE